jgi:probable selenium-dependent hydroxylase accessory protein YqeC
LADVHFALADDAVLPDLASAIAERKVVLVSGEAHTDERLGSTPAHILTQLRDFASDMGIPLLIEADGSRKLPVKSPGENEPVIPKWVNAVMVVVGLSCIGMPGTEDTIHRFAHFADITGITRGEEINFKHIEKMLVDLQGGLKRVPDGAKKIVLLNQADSDVLAEDASMLADRLTGVYDAAVVASLKNDWGGVKYCAERIAGIVLAAGGASRYGQPKAMLEWKGEPLVRHAVNSAISAGLEPVIVVVGATVAPVRNALADLPVEFVENPAWKKGQSGSLRVAISALMETTCAGSNHAAS